MASFASLASPTTTMAMDIRRHLMNAFHGVGAEAPTP